MLTRLTGEKQVEPLDKSRMGDVSAHLLCPFSRSPQLAMGSEMAVCSPKISLSQPSGCGGMQDGPINSGRCNRSTETSVLRFDSATFSAIRGKGEASPKDSDLSLDGLPPTPNVSSKMGWLTGDRSLGTSHRHLAWDMILIRAIGGRVSRLA